MVVLDPIRIDISNLPRDAPSNLAVPNIPGNEAAGTHQVAFAATLYIDAQDFREVSNTSCRLKIKVGGSV